MYREIEVSESMIDRYRDGQTEGYVEGQTESDRNIVDGWMNGEISRYIDGGSIYIIYRNTFSILLFVAAAVEDRTCPGATERTEPFALGSPAQPAVALVGFWPARAQSAAGPSSQNAPRE